MYTPTTTVLSKTLNVMFELAKKEQMKNYQLTGVDMLYMATEMKNGKVDLAWLGDIPAVRQWKGSKVYGDLSEFSYELEALPFYDSFSIHKKSIRRNDLQGIQPRINQLAINIGFYEAELVLAAIVAGTTGLAYDGNAFFANRTVNDNLLAGSGISIDNLVADIATGRRTMMRFQTDQGRFTRYVPNTVLCPTQLEPLFMQIKNSVDYPGGTNRSANPYGQWLDNIIALPDLDDANDWYLAATNYKIKPLVFGFEKLENGQKVLPVLDDSKLASDGIYGYSAEMSGRAGYGFYEMMLKFVNA